MITSFLKELYLKKCTQKANNFLIDFLILVYCALSVASLWRPIGSWYTKMTEFSNDIMEFRSLWHEIKACNFQKCMPNILLISRHLNNQ